MKIYKYKLSGCLGLEKLEIPAGAELLSVALQDDVFVLWALIDPDMPLGIRVIEMVGTGRDMSDAERRYVGTIQDDRYGYVWHFFEVFP